MSCVFRERARSYKGFGFSSVFCGGWAGVIASRLAPTKILCGAGNWDWPRGQIYFNLSNYSISVF